jgi:hypothetical protein
MIVVKVDVENGRLMRKRRGGVEMRRERTRPLIYSNTPPQQGHPKL